MGNTAKVVYWEKSIRTVGYFQLVSVVRIRERSGKTKGITPLIRCDKLRMLHYVLLLQS